VELTTDRERSAVRNPSQRIATPPTS
jgi:hypothetical protein